MAPETVAQTANLAVEFQREEESETRELGQPRHTPTPQVGSETWERREHGTSHSRANYLTFAILSSLKDAIKEPLRNEAENSSIEPESLLPTPGPIPKSPAGQGFGKN